MALLAVLTFGCEAEPTASQFPDYKEDIENEMEADVERMFEGIKESGWGHYWLPPDVRAYSLEELNRFGTDFEIRFYVISTNPLEGPAWAIFIMNCRLPLGQDEWVCPRLYRRHIRNGSLYYSKKL